MENKKSIKLSMRIAHRYLGYFLAGIMFVYALSGVVLIYRDTDFFKQEKTIENTISSNLNAEELGNSLRIRDFEVSKIGGDTLFFKNGTYNSKTGVAIYTVKELPFVMKKLTKLHMAKTSDPLYWLYVFFGVSLMFFVISSFWMFKPKTKNFKKGIAVSIAGIILTLVLLFL